MFSGDPPNYWSMDDIGVSPGVTPSDKRFLISMGPIDMQPGEEQDFILAIVWAQGEDRIASVRKLKNADRHVQMLVDMDLLEPDERWFRSARSRTDVEWVIWDPVRSGAESSKSV